MHYLTNYYKNLCEQLQEKLNILQAKINEGRYNPETGKIDLVRGDMWHPTDEEYAEYLRNKNKEKNSKVPGMKLDLSKPLPLINPKREPRPGDRKPLFPGMKPNPYIKPGIKPANPSKIPSDLFRPGKRPRGGLLPVPGTKPESIIPQSGYKPEVDYLEQDLPMYYTGRSPKDETMIPKVLDGFKKEQEFDNRMGLIPQTPEQRKRFGMSPYDNRMS